MKQLGLFSGVAVKPVKRMPEPPKPKVMHDGSKLNGMYYEESTKWHVSYVLGLRYWEGIVTEADPDWKKMIRLERSIKDGPRDYHENATRFVPSSEESSSIVSRSIDPDVHPESALF